MAESSAHPRTHRTRWQKMDNVNQRHLWTRLSLELNRNLERFLDDGFESLHLISVRVLVSQFFFVWIHGITPNGDNYNFLPLISAATPKIKCNEEYKMCSWNGYKGQSYSELYVHETKTLFYKKKVCKICTVKSQRPLKLDTIWISQMTNTVLCTYWAISQYLGTPLHIFPSA